MTTLDAAVSAAVKTIREVKESAVRRKEKSVAAFIICYRGTEPIAQVTCPDAERALAVLGPVVAGLGADVVSLTHEAWHTELVDSPLTGRRWERGELAQAVKKHHALERGWISDSLNVLVGNRAGDVANVTLPFTADNQRQITWAEQHDMRGEGVQGRLPDTVRAAMRAVPFDVYLHTEGEPPTDRDELDCAVISALQEIQPPTVAFTLFAEPGTRRAALITELLG